MAARLPFHGSQLKLTKPIFLIHNNINISPKYNGTFKYNNIINISKTFYPSKQTTIQNAITTPTLTDNFVRWSTVARKKKAMAHKELKKQRMAEKKEHKRAMMMSHEIRDPLVLQAYKEIEQENLTGKKIEGKKKKYVDEDDEDGLEGFADDDLL